MNYFYEVKRSQQDQSASAESYIRVYPDELKCWTRRNKTHYTGQGLDKSTNINDTIECLKKCRESSHCRAVDIDTATVPNCWYQKKKTFVATEADLKPLNTVTSYLYNYLCENITEGVDLTCWSVTPGHNLPGLELFNVSTLPECLSLCAGKSDCQVVDWDLGRLPRCWIQTKSLMVSAEKLKKTLSVTNFILDRDCLKLTFNLDLGFWGVSHLTRYDSDELEEVDRDDLKSCLSFCQNHDLCHMIDFDPALKPPCRAQTKAFEIKRGKLVESKTSLNFFFKRAQYKKFLKCYRSSFEPKPINLYSDY